MIVLLTAIQAIAVGLLPLGLTFWYHRDLVAITHPRIYFTYSDAIVFVSDGLALIIILIWRIQRVIPSNLSRQTDAVSKTASVLTRSARNDTSKGVSTLANYFVKPDGWLLGICTLASLSIMWSLDWRISLHVSFHLWLVFGLYLSLRDTPQAWRWFAFGSCAALMVQAIIGLTQFNTQSTTFTMALGLEWPGDLTPQIAGASVVQLADGTRWLRAYGTLPHPNILGGFILVFLAAPVTFFLIQPKRKVITLILFGVAIVLIALTFSRSAWVGFGTFALTILFHFRHFERKRLIALGLMSMLCLFILVIPFRQLFFTRVGDERAQTEQVSTYTRLWLIERTWEIIQEHPLLGIGVGNYSLTLSQHVADFYDIEPVHNTPLLIVSELGIGGAVLLIGLAAALGRKVTASRYPVAIILSGTLVALLVISFFDHYLWTLSPGRLLSGTVLGLWASQMSQRHVGSDHPE